MDVVSSLKAKGIDEDKIAEYQAAFQMFDVSNRGYFDEHDLRDVLSRFSQTFSEDDIRYMLRQFSDSDTVTFVSFAASLHEKINDPRYHEAFGDAFDLFDTGMKGELSADDLVDGMQKLGENLTTVEAEEMVKIAAKKDDFVKVMSQAATSSISGGGGAAGGPAATAGAVSGPPGPAGPPRPGMPGPGAAASGPPRPGMPAGAPRPGMPAGAPRPAMPAGAPRPPGPAGAPRPAMPAGAPRPPMPRPP